MNKVITVLQIIHFKLGVIIGILIGWFAIWLAGEEK